MLVLAAVAACGGGGYGGTPEPAVSGDSIVVEVDNLNFYDASITYSYRGGTRRRLGTVTGKSKQSFTIKWEPVNLRFEINFVGGNRTTSQEIYAEAGEIVELRLPPR
jgi:hypothetical protein